MIALGIPYVAIISILGDSGFIEIVEPLIYMGKKYGVKSILYVDKAFEEAKEFQTFQPPPFMQVMFSDHRVDPRHNSSRFGPGSEVLTKFLPGVCNTPIDFVFTNRKQGVHGLVTAGWDLRLLRHAVPVILDVLKVGLDTHDVLNDALQRDEAFAYAMVDRIVFSTPREKQLGLSVCKKFLAPTLVSAVDKKGLVLGDGISNMLVSHRMTPETVAHRLTHPNVPLRMAVAGRMNGNKNIDAIIRVVRPLFALHSMKLTMITQSSSAEWIQKKHQDIAWMTSDKLLGVDKQRFVSEVLPSCDLILNASLFEGYTVLVAEAVYLGVPVLLPRKRWARALVGEEYPFFYGSKEQMYAMIRLIADGKVSREWIGRFEKTREKLSHELASDTSEGVYQAAAEEVAKIDALAAREPHSRILEAIFRQWEIGTVMSLQEIGKIYPGTRCRSRMGVDGFFIYKYLKPYSEPVDPLAGTLRRLR